MMLWACTASLKRVSIAVSSSLSPAADSYQEALRPDNLVITQGWGHHVPPITLANVYYKSTLSYWLTRRPKPYAAAV